MKNTEKIISGLIIGGLFPSLLGLLSVTVWFFFDKAESRPLIYLTAGLLTGILIDIQFLKNWMKQRFILPVWLIASVYVVYNILIYGFFMGFPVVNTFAGIVAGYYFGNRIIHNQIPTEKHPELINKVSGFTGFIMALVCISSGFLAIYHNGAAGMIQNVLNLNFEITKGMIWGIVLVGGMLLIFLNILFTRITMIRIIKNYRLRV